MDSTALRSSLYDQLVEQRKSTRYKWYKDYKLHLATTNIGIILAHELTTANVYDSEAIPQLLTQLTEFEIIFVLGDKAYDNRLIGEQAQTQDILFLTPLIKRKGRRRKDAFARVMPTFLKTPLDALYSNAVQNLNVSSPF